MKKINIMAFFFLLLIISSCDPQGSVDYFLDNKSSYDIKIIRDSLNYFGDTVVICPKNKITQIFDQTGYGVDCDNEWYISDLISCKVSVDSISTLSITKSFSDSSSWTYKNINKSCEGSCHSKCTITIEDKDIQ